MLYDKDARTNGVVVNFEVSNHSFDAIIFQGYLAEQRIKFVES